MRDNVSKIQIDLDEIFRAVVEKYDEISPILVANHFDMTMVRARQKTEDKKPLSNREALLALDTNDISGHEGHCLSDPFPLIKIALQSNMNLNRIFSDSAITFNNLGGLSDSQAPFRQVNEYITWFARLEVVKRLGIELDTKPDLKPLERHLGIAQ